MKYLFFLVLTIGRLCNAADLYTSEDISEFYGESLVEVDIKGCINYDEELGSLCDKARDYVNEKLSELRLEYFPGEMVGRLPIPTIDLAHKLDFRYGHVDFRATEYMSVFPAGIRIGDISKPSGVKFKWTSRDIWGDGTIRNHDVDPLGLGKDLDYDVDISAYSGDVDIVVLFGLNPRVFRKSNGEYLFVLEPKSRVFLENVDFSGFHAKVAFDLVNFLTTLASVIVQTYAFSEDINNTRDFRSPNRSNASTYFSNVKLYYNTFCGSIESCLLGSTNIIGVSLLNEINLTYVREMLWDTYLYPLVVSMTTGILDGSGSVFFDVAMSALIDHELDDGGRAFISMENHINSRLSYFLGLDAAGLLYFENPNLELDWYNTKSAALAVGVF